MPPIALAWGGFAARKTHLAKNRVRVLSWLFYPFYKLEYPAVVASDRGEGGFHNSHILKNEGPTFSFHVQLGVIYA